MVGDRKFGNPKMKKTIYNDSICSIRTGGKTMEIHDRSTGYQWIKASSRIIVIFIRSMVLSILGSLLIWSTWNSGHGKTILFVIGIALILFGTSVMVEAIMEMVDIIKDRSERDMASG
jgi:hypothetical protein